MSETINLDCCEPTEPTNPKKEIFGRKTKRADHLFRLTNPIPGEVKDSRSLKKVFKDYNLIPYAGTTADSGHSLLTWYLLLAHLSPTNAAAIKKKVKYAVGGKARIVRTVDPEYETGEELSAVSPAEAIAYRDTLKTFFEFEGGISAFHRRIGWQYEATGNAFVEMSIATEGGQTRIFLRVHKTTNALFVNTEPGKPRFVAISPVWEDRYLEKYPPRVVSLYPVLSNDGGVIRTMFHLKAGAFTWYGRPPSSSADVYKYREVQDSIYLVKAAASDFTGRLIVEVEDDDPEFAAALEPKESVKAGFPGFVERWEENFTNKGDDPQSVLVSSRPYGGRPMFVFQVSPNTKQDWYRVTGDISEEKIFRAHMVTPRFMGKEVSSGFSTDVYLSDYLLNMEPVIEELHDEITNFSNSILTAGWEYLGMNDQNLFSIAFAPPIQSSLEEYKSGKSSAVQNPNPNPNPNQENEDDNPDQNSGE
jgi:hypothetical protein